MIYFSLFLVFIFINLVKIDCTQLENYSDNDLIDMIKTQYYVIVLFSKKHCEECDDIEKHLINLKNDFKESLNAQVIKAVNSPLVRLYSPAREPAVVFFRHGDPLLYDGRFNEDEIYMQFTDNKAPIVRELSDENFEHLTQASTGSTTGDWFVLFYNQQCIECQRLSAIWESVGAAIKNRVNVARVNKDTTGLSTAKRFNVLKAPEFIFIRQGKFYRYDISQYDIQSFVLFAQEWYKNAKNEKIPVPPTPFDDLVGISLKYLIQIFTYSNKLVNDHLSVVLVFLLGFVSLLIGLVFHRKRRATSVKSEKNKNKKSK